MNPQFPPRLAIMPRRSRRTYRLSSAAMAVVLTMLVVGCSARPLEIGREPELSPVGAGMVKPAAHRVESASDGGYAMRAVEPAFAGSLWRERGADLFRDARARRIGDVLTVTISMKDRASFDNSSNRSRDSSHGFGLNASHAIDWRAFASAGSAKADSALKSNTAQDSKGAIARSENIDLRVAATVTGVLPNGNLVIQGSQELRVNFELRVLTFTGIVNLADIKPDNTISHERIAEARMSYGGRGRNMELQQPAWGHQLLDMVFPF
ncbi:MAG: flagellar basal body L-ring protein FlgH [Hyphomicrobiaceae bacterium]